MVDIPEFVTLAELVMVAAATAIESVAEAESVALPALDIPESVAVAVAVALTDGALPALAVIVTVMYDMSDAPYVVVDTPGKLAWLPPADSTHTAVVVPPIEQSTFMVLGHESVCYCDRHGMGGVVTHNKSGSLKVKWRVLGPSMKVMGCGKPQ